MKLDKNSMLLYAVTDRTWLGENSLFVQIEKTIKAGATVIQLREKNLNFDEFLKVALEVKAITDKYKVLLIINDNVDVAVVVKAICQSVNLPVVAIDGISKDNTLHLSGSGINGVAVISAIFAQPDITKATSELLQLSKQISK